MVAGEASGDVLGGQVLAGLRARYGSDLVVAGLGGQHMATQGLQSLFPMGDVAVMGLVEVLRRYGALRARIHRLKTAIQAFHPDALVLIDAQGLSYRLGRHFAQAPFRRIQLVAPSVWAWKPERAAKVATFLDHMACLFPFEPPYFAAHGLAATFVGHPAVGGGTGKSQAQARAALVLDPGSVWAAVLPGSRKMETTQLCPVFGRLVRQAYAAGQIGGILVPLAEPVADPVRQWTQALNVPYRVLSTAQERANLPAADLALAASGTVSLELSAQGIPAILAYRFHPLTYAYVRRRLTVAYMGLTNLLAGAEVQPEFKLNETSVADLAACFAALATSPTRRERQRARQHDALAALQLDDGLDFGNRVAALI